MSLLHKVGMWNRGFEGHALLLDIIIQLAEWIDIVSWMTIILQIETGIVKQQIDSHITDPDQQNNGLSLSGPPPAPDPLNVLIQTS